MGKMVITDAGIAEVVNAENTGTAPVTLTHIAFGTGQYTATAERTALQAEFKRFDAISGGGVGDNVFHITMEDDSADAYTVYEVGVFTESGTLFAVYSQNTPIIQKSAGSIGMLAVDILLDEMNPESVTIGDTNFVFNPATTERKGVIEIATETEAIAGTDTERAITAATLQAVIQNHSNIVHRSGAETIAGKKTFEVGFVCGTDNFDINKKTATGILVLRGGNGSGQGGALVLYGKDYGADYGSEYAGAVQLDVNGESKKSLRLHPDGRLIWDGKNIVRSVDGVNADTAGNVNLNALPKSGGTMTGAITLDGTASVFAADRDLWFAHSTGNNSYRACVLAGDAYNTGASLYMHGKDYASNPGQFCLQAHDGTKLSALVGNPDGTLVWKNLVLASGYIKKNDKTSGLNICSGQAYNDSPAISLYPSDYSDANMAGRFVLRSGENEYQLTGKSDGTLQWNGTALSLSGTIQTSVNQALVKTDTKGGIQVCGGTNLEDGGSILGYGMNYELNPEFKGALRLQAMDGTNKYDVVLFPKGRLRLGNGTRMNFQDNEDQHIFVDNNGDLLLGDTDGAFIRVCGQESSINPSGFQFRAKSGDGDPIYFIGKPDGTLTWGGKSLLTTATQNPTGTVIALAGNSTPSGYLLCNGAAVSRTTYADLFAAIGTTYGTGNGSTTFNLPDYTDRVLQGSSTAGTVLEAGLPNITGTFLAEVTGNHTTGAFVDTQKDGDGNSISDNSKDNIISFDASRCSDIYGNSDTVQPPAVTVRFCIKY